MKIGLLQLACSGLTYICVGRKSGLCDSKYKFFSFEFRWLTALYAGAVYLILYQ